MKPLNHRSHAIPCGLVMIALAAWSEPALGGLTGNLFVSYAGTGKVHSFTSSGVDLGPFGDTAIFSTFDYGMAFDAKDNLYVANNNNYTIWKFGPTGAIIGPFATFGLDNPFSLAFDRSGILYVANPEPANDVVRFDATGAYKGIFASAGLNGLRNIAFDQHGDLFAANYSNNTIHEFGPTGTDLGIFATTPNPVSIAFDTQGDVYAANYSGNTIHEFSSTGADLGTFAHTGLNEPAGIAFDSAGNLFVANIGNNTIHEFGPTGIDLGTFASTGQNSLPDTLVFAPNAVPEPSSAALLVLGGSTLIVLTWRGLRSSKAVIGA